jgi:hypothetical protein
MFVCLSWRNLNHYNLLNPNLLLHLNIIWTAISQDTSHQTSPNEIGHVINWIADKEDYFVRGYDAVWVDNQMLMLWGNSAFIFKGQ